MRRLSIVLAALGSLAAMSCGGGKLVKFADFHYKISCREGAMTGMGCVSTVRDINNSDGTDGVRVSQCLISRSGAMPSLNFNVTAVDSTGITYGIQVAGAYYDSSGTAVGGGSCVVTIKEGSNSFQGRCGPATPSTMVPCQITGIMETYDNPTDMNPQVVGNIVCAHLPNIAAPTQVREVEADSTTPGQLFPFRIVFCDNVMPH